MNKGKDNEVKALIHHNENMEVGEIEIIKTRAFIGREYHKKR